MKKIYRSQVCYLLGFMLVAFALVPGLTLASCGSISTIDTFGQTESVPIEDCDNPFGETENFSYPAVLFITEQVVVDGAELAIATTSQASGFYELDAGRNFAFNPFKLFQKQDQDYIQIAAPRGPAFTLDALSVGTYVAVFTYEVAPVLSQDQPAWWQRILSWFSPTTVFASPFFGKEVMVWEFTVVEPEPEPPAGASSVLFLPGIMGSRLYEESDICSDEIEIQERWFSRDDCDHLRMVTSFLGESNHKIFTTLEGRSIVDETLGLNLYKSFLNEFSDFEEEGLITDFVAFPYDWRLQLEDVIGSTESDGLVVGGVADNFQEGLLYQIVQDMAEESLSGKVSIVAHSNGGLVSKEFLSRLEQENDPLLDKIDNLFLVGVPQSGTPDAVVSILHGAAIGGGFVLEQSVARTLVNTMPAVHHLLPSEVYFASTVAAEFPVIGFQSGELTDAWIGDFGPEINSVEDLHGFLSKDSGRLKPTTDNLLQPEVVDNFLLDYATVAHAIQSDWLPPDNLMVHQIAGTGVVTPLSITYFTDSECISRSVFQAFTCTEYAPKLGYRITLVDEGDGTVAFTSAKAMEGEQVRDVYVDLFKYNDDKRIDRVHRNILEIDEIQAYIKNALSQEVDSDYDYLSDKPVSSQNESKITFQLHSPLDMQIVVGDSVVSSSTNDIPNATYRRFGEVQYISIPKSVGDYELILVGLREGSFTLEIEEWQGSRRLQRHDFIAIPTGGQTRVSLTGSDTNNLPSTFTLDYDGDGAVDAVVSEDGTMEIMTLPPAETENEAEPEISKSETTRTSPSATRVGERTPGGQVAGVSIQVSTDELYHRQLAELLTELSRLLTLWGNIYI